MPTPDSADPAAPDQDAPGAPDAADTAEADDAAEATDTPPTPEDATPDEPAPPDIGPDAALPGGTLMITEIMYDPKAVYDDQGEWVELFNAGATPVDLAGWKIRDYGSNAHVIATSVEVPIGGFAVLGRNGSPAANGGLQADYVFDNFFLGNTTDSVVLEDPNGDIVDAVTYDTAAPWPAKQSGRSIELQGLELDNALGSSWAHATAVYGAGDHGTPGTWPPALYELLADVPDHHQPALAASLRWAPDDAIEEHVLAQLAGAKSEVRVALYSARLNGVRDTLAALVAAGVDVHVALDAEQQALDFNTMGEEMVALGIPVTLVENTSGQYGAMHNKFVVIDGLTVLTGSANYAFTSWYESDNVILTIDNADLAARYRAEFDELVAGGSAESPSYPAGTAVRAWMGPEDDLEYRVLDEIEAAKESVLVAMFDLNHEALVDGLADAEARGLDVVVLIDTERAAATNADQVLAASGVAVALADNLASDYADMHLKLAVVDTETVLLGSYNWTANGSYNNDENLVVIDDTTLAVRAAGEIAYRLKSYAPTLAHGLPTGAQDVTFRVANLALQASADLELEIVSGGTVGELVPLTDEGGYATTLSLAAGTRIVYRYRVNRGDHTAIESGELHSFAVPFATGPFVVADAFRP